MNYKGIIFDLDGTLLDTLDDLADSFNYALQKHNFPPHPVEAYRLFIGEGARKAIERALPKSARNEETISKSLETFKAWYDQHYHIKSAPYPGISTVLAALRARGLRLAVLSNKPHDFTLKCVQYYFPDTFNWVQGHLPPFPRKPEPDAALQVLKKLELLAAEVVFVGDTSTDMITAKNSGIKSVGVAWGFRGREELQKAEAGAIIESAEQLLEI